MSPPGVEVLPWDTDFFGFPIARIGDAGPGGSGLAAAVADCRSAGVRCAYLLCGIEETATLAEAVRRGFRPVDVRVTLRTKLEDLAPTPSDASGARDVCGDDLPELRSLARSSFRDSRFFVDGRFATTKAEGSASTRDSASGPCRWRHGSTGGRMKIPFNRATIVGRERTYMEEALAGGHISGDGPFTKRCEQLLEGDLGASRVLLTTSCTHALEIAALLLRLEPGDEVILPSFTFVSTANAFALHGATPVFVDVREDTLNLDETLLEAKIGPRTRAIVPVHYAGIGCEMVRILELARGREVRVIEDAAHGLFGKRGGRWLGTFGDLATLSFHETKNVTCGEGGALVVNDATLVERAEILREKGTDRSRFFRGQVDKYTWVDTGSSYVLSDLLAAFLLGQLEERERIQARRRALFERYAAGLAGWAGEQGVRLPFLPRDAEPAWHLFHLLLPDIRTRQRFLAWLRDAEILGVFHYLPLHDSPMGRRFGYRRGDCPVSESVSDRLARLPLFFDLSDADQDSILDRIRDFRV